MDAFLNGRILPLAEANVSVLDRGFLYGDGLFETMRVRGGKLFRWEAHLGRLKAGAAALRIDVPFPGNDLARFAADLTQRNGHLDGILRLTVSRGEGPRGYSPRGASQPVVVMTTHAMPATNPTALQWRLITSSYRVLSGSPLAQLKTCNKLAQVMARAEADDRGADEAILLNEMGDIAECSSSNLFWVEDETVCTTPLSNGVLPGVTRAVVLELAGELGLGTREESVIPEALQQSQGVFVSLSTLGIVEVVTLDGHGLSQSAIVPRLRDAYSNKLDAECR